MLDGSRLFGCLSSANPSGEAARGRSSPWSAQLPRSEGALALATQPVLRGGSGGKQRGGRRSMLALLRPSKHVVFRDREWKGLFLVSRRHRSGSVAVTGRLWLEAEAGQECRATRCFELLIGRLKSSSRSIESETRRSGFLLRRRWRRIWCPSEVVLARLKTGGGNVMSVRFWGTETGGEESTWRST